MCTDIRACVYACMPIRRLVHAYYSTFNPPLLYVRTLTYLHTHIHTLTCRRKLTICPLLHAQTHACTRRYIPRTHTLTRLLEKGVRIWEGMVLCIRPSLAIGIHRGTLAYIRWGIRLECAREERPGEGSIASFQMPLALRMVVSASPVLLIQQLMCF